MNPYTLRRSSENLMFGFSDDLCFQSFSWTKSTLRNHGANVVKKLCSVGFAHESLNISDDLSYTFPHRQYLASLLSALFHLPFEACACGMVEGAGGELAGDL